MRNFKEEIDHIELNFVSVNLIKVKVKIVFILKN